MAATPLSKHKSPKALVNCAMPSRSTNTIEVRAIKAAVGEVGKKMRTSRNKIDIEKILTKILQEKRPKTPEVMQNPM